MAKHHVAPTPHNFTVWFTHVSGENAELSRTVDILVTNGQEFTAQQNELLYQRFFSSGPEVADLIEAGSRLDGMIAEVMSQLGVAGQDASRYGDTLANFNAALPRGAAKDMQLAVETMLRETNRMAERNKALETQLASSSAEIDHLRQDLDGLRRVALINSLTGIANRKCFDQSLREAAAAALEAGTSLALIMIDIDHFKALQRQFRPPARRRGVASGRADLARRDARGGDVVARYGGEEFAVILLDVERQGRRHRSPNSSARVSRASASCADGTGEKPRRRSRCRSASPLYVPGEPLSGSSRAPTRRSTSPSAPAETGSPAGKRDLRPQAGRGRLRPRPASRESERPAQPQMLAAVDRFQGHLAHVVPCRIPSGTSTPAGPRAQTLR